MLALERTAAAAVPRAKAAGRRSGDAGAAAGGRGSSRCAWGLGEARLSFSLFGTRAPKPQLDPPIPLRDVIRPLMGSALKPKSRARQWPCPGDAQAKDLDGGAAAAAPAAPAQRRPNALILASTPQTNPTAGDQASAQQQRCALPRPRRSRPSHRRRRRRLRAKAAAAAKRAARRGRNRHRRPPPLQQLRERLQPCGGAGSSSSNGWTPTAHG